MKKILPALCLCLCAAMVAAGENPAGPRPWEYWKDPGVLSRIPDGLHTLFRSSHAPGWAPFDRSSEGDPRFLKIVDGEAVIFEAEGVGILSRIWMTQGEGRAEAIDEQIRLRIRINGEAEPLIDVAAAAFFSGVSREAVPILVQDYRDHGGGNLSRLPISFRSGCRVSLVGAEKAKIWYQVSGMALKKVPADSDGSREKDARKLFSRFRYAGRDPWPIRDDETRHDSIRLEMGLPLEVLRLEGSGQINALLLLLPRDRWPDVELRMDFDGRETVNLGLPWFFGIGGAECPPPNSLFIGGVDGILYCYFPMPFREQARVFLSLKSGDPVDVEYSVRSSRSSPPKDAGSFEARAIDSTGFNTGRSSELLRLSGRVRLAGIFLSVGGVGGAWDFLEGDEEFFIDGEKTASWHGTGVEDFFGGGFYFRGASGLPEPFLGPLSGLTCVHPKRPESAAMYRLMPADGPVAGREMVLRWEGGSRGDVAVRWRGVAWLYRRQQDKGEDADRSR